MKLLIWKIIALTTIFFGGLGPQVAVGNEAPVQPLPSISEQVEIIPVVTAASEIRIVAGGSSASCSSSNFQLSRFDLLLWSDCEASLALGTVETEQDIVVAATQEWPELSVTSGPYQSITSTYESLSSSENPVAGFAYQATTETKIRSSVSVRQLSLGTKSSFMSLALGNSEQPVVLRC